MRRNLSLGQRISLGFLVMTLLVLVTSGLGLWFTSSARTTVNATLDGVQQVQSAAELGNNWADIVRIVDNVLLTRRTDLIEQQLESQIGLFTIRLTELHNLKLGSQSSLSPDRESNIDTLVLLGNQLIRIVREVEILMQQGSWARGQVLRHTEMASLQRRLTASLDKFRQGTQTDVDRVVAESVRVQSSTNNYWVLAAALTVAAGLLMGLSVTRSITNPVSTLIQQTQLVTQRDFQPVVPLPHRDEIGDLSRAFAQMTNWLRESYEQLEQRVAERTRDLTLAAEVSRSLSQVRDLNTLLTEAVELIRARFDLYYTQVYLLDANQQTLTLQAGTGLLGEELVRRGHRLPLGPTSINGQAAIERRAVIVADTQSSPIFRPNPLLPNTRSEMAVPLLVGNDVVGVLDLQSSQENGLTEESLPAFAALAGQLAITIQNARLFSETVEIRRQAEAQARRLTREGWHEYMDALQQRDFVGYRYTPQGVEPVTDLAETNGSQATLTTPITLTGEPIGAILVQPDENSHEQRAGSALPAEQQSLLQAVAGQVAQRVNSLRLLAEANRYREEAEAASRRLTRQAWEQVTADSNGQSLGYAYLQGEVVPAAAIADAAVAEPAEAPPTWRQELKVREEPVGLLEIALDEQTPFAAGLVQDVAARLSSHLENLRLTQETQEALAETEELYQLSSELSQARDYEGILNVLCNRTIIGNKAQNVSLNFFDQPWTESRPPEWVTVLARRSELPPQSVLDAYRLSDFPSAFSIIHPHAPTLIEDVRTAPDLDPHVRALYADQFGAVSTIFVPLEAGGEWIGYINAIYQQPTQFPERDIRIVMALAGQAAVAVQNLRSRELAEQRALETQKRNQELALINRVVSAVSSTLDLHQELSTIAAELVSALDMGHVGIALFTPDRSALVVYADASRNPDEMSAVGTTFEMAGNELSQEVVRTRQPAIVRDAQHDARTAPVHDVMRWRRTETLILYPLFAGNEVIGTLGMDILEKERTFTAAEGQLVETIIFQISTAIKQSQLFAQLQEALAETDVLYQVSRQLNAAATLADILDIMSSPAIVPGIKRITLSAIELDEEGAPQTAVVRNTWRAPDFTGETSPVDYRFDVRKMSGFRLWFKDSEAPLLIGDLHHDERINQVTRRIYHDMGALGLIPLKLGRRWLGMLDLNWTEPRVFAEKEQRIYSSVGTQVAIAISNQQLLQEAQARAQQERILREVSARVRNTTDVNSVLRVAAQEVGKALGRQTFIYLSQEDEAKAPANGDK